MRNCGTGTLANRADTFCQMYHTLNQCSKRAAKRFGWACLCRHGGISDCKFIISHGRVGKELVPPAVQRRQNFRLICQIYEKVWDYNPRQPWWYILSNVSHLITVLNRQLSVMIERVFVTMVQLVTKVYHFIWLSREQTRSISGTAKPETSGVEQLRVHLIYEKVWDSNPHQP